MIKAKASGGIHIQITKMVGAVDTGQVSRLMSVGEVFGSSKGRKARIFLASLICKFDQSYAVHT